jgi:hypothetical protein
VDEEQKLGDAAERLSASAFLARYKRFRYVVLLALTKEGSEAAFWPTRDLLFLFFPPIQG